MKWRKPIILICVLFCIGLFFTPKGVCMQLRSDAFEDGDRIPSEQAYETGNISPGLEWSTVPIRTKSLVLIMDDPDAPGGTWIHWLLYNIPPDKRELREGLPQTEVLDDGMMQGTNSFSEIGYGGPWPPPGPAHRYIFTLYALDEVKNIPAGSNKEELLDQIERSIIEQTALTGIYSR